MFESEDHLNRADWPLLQNGAVNLFWNQGVLAEAQQALSELKYEIANISCERGWESVQEQFSSLLKWEEQFGYAPWTGNLNAFNDGLRGFPFGPSKRCALTLSMFHVLAASDRATSYAVLDLLEAHARDYLLFGKTLVVLVQTDDNRFEGPAIGGRRANWNQREWLDDRVPLRGVASPARARRSPALAGLVMRPLLAA